MNETNPQAAIPTEVFHSTSGRRDSIAIMTMVYNESVNLPIWLNHYRRAAPSAFLLIIDHASNDGSTDNLQGAARIPIPRNKMDELDRTFLINSLQQGLLRYYDVVIYTDCDELLVADPRKSPSLDAYLNQKRFSHAAPVGINVVHMVDREPPLDFAQPLLQQRRFCQFHSQLCKPVITRVPLRWEPGFHSCEQKVTIDEDLYLFHIKQIDMDQAVRRQRISREVAWSSAAVEAGHGAHHRYDDERFVREFFLDPANELRAHGARQFAFGSEIARLQSESHEVAGILRVPDFKGPIVEIPEILHTAF